MSKTKLTILYDGACPLCKREVNFLQSRNNNGYLNFFDIDKFDLLSEKNTE